MSKPASQGVRLTLGFRSAGDRYQCVIPYLSDTAFPADAGVPGDFATWIVGTLIPAWQPLFPASVEFVGYQVDGLVVAAPVIPARVNFASGLYAGAATGDATPPQTSVLYVYYSTEQAAIAERLRTAKTFIGPAPEDVTAGGVITDAGFLTDHQALCVAMEGFVGATTWKRGLGPTTANPDLWHTCNGRAVRTKMFTQRRRNTPVI